MLEATSWDPKGLTRINDFGDSMIMESLALAVDVFWDQLNPKTGQIFLIKSRLEQWILSIAELSRKPKFFHACLATYFAPFVSHFRALIDEVPDALNWLEYIYELWLAQHPKMAEEDGAF